MKRLSVYLLCACLVSTPAWGAGKKKKPSAAEVESMKAAAKENICGLYSEYINTRAAFQDASRGGFSGNSHAFRLMQERDQERAFLVKMQDKYKELYGEKFAPIENPRYCFSNVVVVGGGN